METIKIKYYQYVPHISQILTGFCLLQKAEPKKYHLEFEYAGADDFVGPFVEVIYRGKIMVYDTMDGYQDDLLIRKMLDRSDFYFKRSYSAEKNRALGLDDADKIKTLGFNYHVSCKGHPVDKPYWKERIKYIAGIENNMYSNTYFNTERFEELPTEHDGKPLVLFAARLWEKDEHLPNHLNKEREYINQMRIKILKSLKSMGEIDFVGGVSDTPYARKIVPELILPEKMTNRRSYIYLMHKADICIATMGLHESIGWKTGEYVAAAKAIVSEKLHYQVPGDFLPGKNYLEFSDDVQCIDAVKSLINSPEKLLAMRLANRDYYCVYLRPDQLIRNTLDIVDEAIENRII